MKNFVQIALVGLVLLTASSCKDKLNLNGDQKESAVVVGILDQSNSTHYVKITRTYIGDGITSAIDIAAIADSSYFNTIDVKIQEILADGSSGRLFNLHDTTIHEKDENGVFYAPEQKVYVFYTDPSQPLISDAKYQLTANIDNGRIVVTGTTALVSGITPGTWSNTNSSLKLAASGTTLGVYADQTINVSNVGTSYKMNAKVGFNYREYTTGLVDSSDHLIIYNLGESDVTPGLNSSQLYNLNGETFYTRIKENVPVSTSIEKRIYLGIDVTITGASRELANYIEVNKPSSSLAQNKPKYTNLKITEGHTVIGIFGSRQTLNVYKPAVGFYPQMQGIDKKSRRELCIGPLTGSLSFCSQHVSDAAPVMETWYCN